MSNYFISYDLHRPGQDYDAIGEAIQQMGAWAKIHFSLYYLSSSFNADQVHARIAAACDQNDKFIVITASSATWNLLPQQVSAHIQAHWNR